MQPVEHTQLSSTPNRAELEQRLRPGSWSTLGFLGTHESLDAVLARDAEAVARLGVSYDELADALEKLLTTALELFHAPVPEERIEEVLAHQTYFPNLYQPASIPHFDLHNLPDIKSGFLIGHLQVFLVTYKEWQSCPWGCNAYSSSDFMIVNRETGESVTAPELMPHLVRTHGFFAGPGSPYRSDPERLARVLALTGG